MATRYRWLVPVLAVVLIGGVAVGLSRAGSDGDKAAPGDVASASAVLGAQLPEVRATVPGLNRSGIGIDPQDRPLRQVHVSYAVNGKNVALLNVFKGELQAVDGQETLSFADGVKASVRTTALRDGSTDVSYAWNRGGLAFALHVNLGNGIDRTVADGIAASVR